MAEFKYTDEALTRMARAAADMIIALKDGDVEGATAAKHQAEQIASNPRSQRKR